jgi:hypothetical protein
MTARDTVIKIGERAEVHLNRERQRVESTKTAAPEDRQVIFEKRELS